MSLLLGRDLPTCMQRMMPRPLGIETSSYETGSWNRFH